MLTTDGFSRSTTSAKLTNDGIGGALALRAGASRAAPAVAGAPAETADRATPPATIAPTRKATTPVSATVTRVNRRDMNMSVFLV